MFSKGKCFIEYSFNEIFHVTPKNFDPPIITDISKYWRLVARPTRPCTYLNEIFSNVGPIFVKGKKFQWKLKKGNISLGVSRSIHNLFRWLVGKMGIMTEVRPISGLIIVFLPLFGMENREYFKRGKKDKEKKEKIEGKWSGATLPGLEPGIPWFVVRCLIHWATGPSHNIFSKNLTIYTN